MSKPKNTQYQAYSVASRTVGKTRQIVMLYDGAIRFVKQAQIAISEKRIEDRFKKLKQAADVVIGLQTSLDFENGGAVAETLNQFYTNMHIRIMSVNFHRKGGEELCDGIIADLKQMRDVWDSIDRNLTTTGESVSPSLNMTSVPPAASGNFTVSA